MNRRRTSSQGCLYFGVFFQFLDINVFKFFKTVQKDIVKLHLKFYYG